MGWLEEARSAGWPDHGQGATSHSALQTEMWVRGLHPGSYRLPTACSPC